MGILTNARKKAEELLGYGKQSAISGINYASNSARQNVINPYNKAVNTQVSKVSNNLSTLGQNVKFLTSSQGKKYMGQNLSDVWTGKTYAPNVIGDYSKQATGIKNPVVRNVAQAGLGRIRAGSNIVQGVTDVVGPNRTKLQRGLGALGVVGGYWQTFTPTGALISTAEPMAFGALEAKRKGANALEGAVSAPARNVYASDALGLQNTGVGAVLDIGVGLLLNKGYDKVALARNLGKISKAFDANDVQTLAQYAKKYPKLFKDAKSLGLNFTSDAQRVKRATRARKEAKEYAKEKPDFMRLAKLAREGMRDVLYGNVVEQPKTNIVGSKQIIKQPQAPTYDVLDKLKSSSAKGRSVGEVQTPSGIKTKLSDAKKAFRSQIMDRFAAIEDFTKPAVKELTTEQNPYKRFRLLAGVDGKIATTLKTQLGPILKKEANRLDDLDVLLKLERMQEKAGQGFKTQLSTDEIQKGFGQLEQKYGREGVTTLKQSSQEIRNFGNTLLDKLKASGIIGDESYNAIKKNNQFYTPFEIVDYMTDNLEKGYGSGSYNTASQDVIKAFKGSEREVGNTIDAFIRKAGKVIALTEKNDAMTSLVDLRKTGLYDDVITPIRLAEDVKKKIDIFTEVGEMGKNKRYLERLLQTRNRWARGIQSELNRLNQQGIEAYLKRADDVQLPKVQGTLQTTTKYAKGMVRADGEAFYTRYPIQATTELRNTELSVSDTKKLINALVNETPERLDAIKNKIKSRDKNLGYLMEEVGQLRNSVDFLKTKRLEKMEEAGKLLTQKESGREVVSLFRDGVQEQYSVPEEVAVAIKNLDKQQMNFLTKALTFPAKVLRLGATGLNVAFIPANLARDFADAVYSEASEGGIKAVGKFLQSYPRAFASAVKRDELYDKWLMSGGAQSSFIKSEVLGSPQTTLKRLAGKEAKFAKVLSAPKDLIEFIGRVAEESTRLTRFEKGLRAGESAMEAAYKSRNITVDFGRSGTAMKLANQFIPFLNAGTQGTGRMLSLIKDNPKRATIAATTLIGMPTAALFAHNRNFKDFRDIQQHEKDVSWIIMVGDRTPEEVENDEPLRAIKIPKGNQLKPLSNILENFLTYFDSEDPRGFAEMSAEVLGNVVADTSPIGAPTSGENARQFVGNLTPQAIKPFVEQATNTNLFTGRNIVPQSMQGVEPREQYDDRTSLVAKTAGSALNISPKRIDALVRGVGAGVGQQLISPSRFVTDVGKRFYGPTGGGAEQRERADIDKISTQSKTESYIRKRDAKKLDEELSKMDKAQANAKVAEIKAQDPLLYKKLKAIVDEKKLDRSYTESRIAGLTVQDGARAKYIAMQAGKLKTKEEKNAYIADLKAKKIITAEVWKQLLEMKKSGTL